MIIIVNYGLGNLNSILNMFKKIGVTAEISDNPTIIESAEKLLLPGVGAFDHAMQQIHQRGLLEVLNFMALEKKVPVLGICLGMQLLTKKSEEGKIPGLGWVSAETKRLPKSNGLKIPHMGWNTVICVNQSPLTHDFEGKEYRFYFVHSYYVDLLDSSHAIMATTHGIEFCSALQHGNIYGAQFHPEKSHRFGMQLLKNFSNI